MKTGKEALDALNTPTLEHEVDPLRIYVKLKEVLKERGISQKELAEATKIRPAAISELANNQRTTINKEHVEKIAAYLNISNLSELITFETESELMSMSHPYQHEKDGDQ